MTFGFFVDVGQLTEYSDLDPIMSPRPIPSPSPSMYYNSWNSVENIDAQLHQILV